MSDLNIRVYATWKPKPHDVASIPMRCACHTWDMNLGLLHREQACGACGEVPKSVEASDD